MLTHANLTVNRAQVTGRYPDPRSSIGRERVLGVLPMFHIFAMTVVMNYTVGVAEVMVLLPRFDLDMVLKVIHRRRPFKFPVVPSLLNAINQAGNVGKYDLSSLDFCISGGAALPAEVMNEFQAKTGCTVIEGYGLTEASPVCTCNPPDGNAREGSIGLPLEGTDIEIRSLSGSGAKQGVGEKEICVIGPQVMRGYWNRLDDTADVLRDGRLHTGDIGYADKDGFVFLVDRIKDVIITNGYNVYPRNIEEAVIQHASVVEVTVIGVPDTERERSPRPLSVSSRMRI